MFKSLVVLSALAISTATAAHADSISGYFSATGTDNFTSSTITFDGSAVAGQIGGTFANYLTDGNAINFLGGNLPYKNGVNMPPRSIYPSGFVPIFSTTESGETFTFEMSQYNAGYITDGSNGCTTGSTCLDVTGLGYFLASGPVNGTSGAATFSFTSQYVSGQPLDSITSFSASTAAAPGASAVTPEPTSLALLGTGLLGMFGVSRRKFAR